MVIIPLTLAVVAQWVMVGAGFLVAVIGLVCLCRSEKKQNYNLVAERRELVDDDDDS
jgi:hypothetical protein